VDRVVRPYHRRLEHHGRESKRYGCRVIATSTRLSTTSSWCRMPR
jgi:hypothetical protein